MNNLRTTLLALASVALAAPAAAQVNTQVVLHGYGEGSYGRTDENVYLAGSEAGNWENIKFGLTLDAMPVDRLRVGALFELEQNQEESEFFVDVAFAEWLFSDAARVRVGKSRLPFGLYAETLEVGTLRPFFHLPQGVYGPAGIVTENYEGAALSGTYYSASNWGLRYDLYGGRIVLEGEAGGNAVELFEVEEVAGEGLGEPVDDVFGSRLVLVTPIDGLEFGASAYSGVAREEEARHLALGASTSYVAGPWFLRSEWGYHSEEGEYNAHAVYGEAAYTFAEQVQLAVRYDWADMNIVDDDVDTDDAPSLFDHADWGFGLNYLFSPGFILKGSLQLTDGNLVAGPEEDELEEAIEDGTLKSKTTYFLLGIQYSF